MTSKIVLTLFFILTTLNLAISSEDQEPAKARIESCPGCSLNRLPEVRKFIYEDVPNYEGVEFKKIHGAPPELVLLNEAEDVLERISLRDLTREDCNELLQSKGFRLKESSNKEL